MFKTIETYPGHRLGTVLDFSCVAHLNRTEQEQYLNFDCTSLTVKRLDQLVVGGSDPGTLHPAEERRRTVSSMAYVLMK